jgi:peptidoglycan/LPS O-acetylase OafA/YrhL
MAARLRRVTSSGAVIPELDGLRFIAISLVVTYHIVVPNFLEARGASGASEWVRYSPAGSVMAHVIEHANKGVELFFVISAFIVSRPFARHYLLQGDSPSLRGYFKRRFWRIYPPYACALLVFFVAKVAAGREEFSRLLGHLGSSLLYCHHLIHGGASKVSAVAWSLEVEVQFYLAAPLFVLILRLHRFLRRSLMTAAVLLFPLLQQTFSISKYSLVGCAQFFFSGLLLADLFTFRRETAPSAPTAWLVGGTSLVLILLLDHEANVAAATLFPWLILCFYWFALTSDGWRRALGAGLPSIIGGMCYSIYLVHSAVIQAVGELTRGTTITEYFLPNVSLQVLMIAPPVLVVSALFFITIERPFMHPRP